MRQGSRLGGAQSMGKGLTQRDGEVMGFKKVLTIKGTPELKWSWGRIQLSLEKRTCSGNFNYFLPSF